MELKFLDSRDGASGWRDRRWQGEASSLLQTLDSRCNQRSRLLLELNKYLFFLDKTSSPRPTQPVNA